MFKIAFKASNAKQTESSIHRNNLVQLAPPLFTKQNMRLVLFLATLMALAGSSVATNVRREEPEPVAMTGASASAPTAETAREDESKAHEAVVELKTSSAKNWAKVLGHCSTEVEKTQDWIDHPVVDVEAITKKRLAAEGKLLAALMSRVEGLKNFLKRLKLTRKRLRKRIKSVNAIFKLKFDENMENVKAATTVMQDIGHLKLAPYNPKISLIKNFKCIACNNAALIETTERALVLASAGCAEKDECSGATKIAFDTYKTGLELNKLMGINFEKERVVLAGMRNKIRELIDTRTAKLNKLLAQIERIKGAMGDDNYDAAKKSLPEHLNIFKPACQRMTSFSTTEKAQLSKLLGAMDNTGELRAKKE